MQQITALRSVVPMSLRNASYAAYSRLFATKATAPKVSVIVNPATGKKVTEYPYLTDEQAAKVVAKSHAAFQEWKKTPHKTRAAMLRKAGDILRANSMDFAKLMAVEMGKAVREGKAEAEKCATVCDYYAEHGEKFMQPEHIDIGAKASYVVFCPLGCVLIVMPWNFPFWQVFRQAACALTAGNTMILKHASNVFGSAVAIEKVFRDAGFPEGVFQNLPISGGQAAKVLENPLVKAVAITGSTPVGRLIGEHAGRLLKKSVLELGGSDPYLILEDANIEHAAQMCTNGRILNCGQSCIGAKRFVVTEAVYDEFITKFVAKMSAIKVGDPLDMDTQMGPMVSVASRAEVHQQVLDSVAKGAKVLCGGVIPSGPEGSAFYPPTIVANVKKGMPAYEEEIFGPVASVIKVKDEKEAIFVANDTPFGLGAAVFSNNLDRAMRIANEEIESGLVFVNDHVKSDARLPFGGTKESGLGRECSHYGLREFVNIKTVVVRTP